MSFRQQYFVGFYWFYSVYLMCIIGIFSFYTFGIHSTVTFHMTDETTTNAAWMGLYQIFFFFIALKLLFILVSKFKFYRHSANDKEDSKTVLLTFKVSLLICFSIFVVLIVSGGKHAVLSALTGGSMHSARMHNSNFLAVPSVVISLYIFYLLIVTCLYGAVLRRLTLLKKMFYLVLILALVSFLGDKAIVLNLAVLSGLVYLTINRVSLRRSILLVFALSIATIIGLYFLIKLQVAGDELLFLDYFILRVVYAQVHGYFEQYALQLRSAEYIINSIPIYSFFVESNTLSKDLMMQTWGASLLYTTDTGVMNSLFGGEAIAIGGFALLLASPFIVGLSFFFLFLLMYIFFIKFLRFNSFTSSVVSGAFVIANYMITTDIAGFLFFKYHVMMLLFLMPLLLIFKFLFASKRTRN